MSKYNRNATINTVGGGGRGREEEVGGGARCEWEEGGTRRVENANKN